MTPTSPATGSPTGTVAFYVNGSATPVSGCSAVTLSATTPFVATCNFTEATPAIYSISAVYSGDTNFLASGGTTSATVGQGSTGTNTTTDLSAYVSGQTITVTATVTPTSPATGSPTGTVAFYVNGSATPVSGCSAVTLSATTPFVATCSFTEATRGIYSISASYGRHQLRIFVGRSRFRQGDQHLHGHRI